MIILRTMVSLTLPIWIAVLFLAQGAWAQAGGIAETLGLNPGPNIDKLNLNWYSSTGSNDTNSYVILFDALSGTALDTVKGTYGRASPGKYWHKATLIDLKAGKKYRYSVSNNGKKDGWSDKYDYTAPSGHTSFKFAAIADAQLDDDAGHTDNWKETVAKIANAGANHIISAGDQVDVASEGQYKRFFAPEALRNISVAPVLGNHDMSSTKMFADHFNLPNELDKSNYYYLYNNVLFIGLNSGAGWNGGNITSASANVAMFENTIAKAKNAHKGDYNWIVVFHHIPTLSPGIHANDGTYYINAGFHALLTREGVNLVVAGHDHIYARSKPMDGNNVSTSDTGTIYLQLTSASGMKFYPAHGNRDKLDAVFTQSNGEHSYTIIDVNGEDSLVIKTYAAGTGKTYDGFTLKNFFRKKPK